MNFQKSNRVAYGTLTTHIALVLMMANSQLTKVTPSVPVRSFTWLRPVTAQTMQVLGLVGLGVLSVMRPAVAHHAMDGRTPANFFEGFLSGLAHPVIGVDHLAFVIAIGLLAIGRVRGALLPVFFLVTALMGTGLHLMAFNLPVPELVVSLSVLALGAILLLGKQLPFAGLAGLAAIAGVFHGYAYGESIIGAETTPLVAYLLGFSLIQYAISFLAFWLGGKFVGTAVRPASVLRYVGGAICAIGAVFLASAMQG